MKKLLFLAICVALQANDLKSLLDIALTNNKMIQSKELSQNAKLKQLESSQNAYYPTVDAGGYFQSSNVKTPSVAGDIYSGYAKVGVDLYDGGKKKNDIEKNKALLNSAKYDKLAYQKSLQLDIINDYFNILSAKENLEALKNKKNQLNAELQRVKKFYEVGSATKDDIDKLQAELSNSSYQIEALKFQIFSLKQMLSIKIGQDIKDIQSSNIIEPKDLTIAPSDDIKAMIESAKSLEFSANSLNSTYKPQVRLEDTFSIYNYGRSDSTHYEGADHQNQLMLSFNIRLFDNDVVKKQKESIMIEKMALQKQINQQKDMQNINAKLAKSKIQTIKAQIKSAKSSLISANSAFKTISQKFQAGVIDNVAYLDTLSVKTSAKAQYEKALNDLQIAYATYYYYTNKNIKDYIK
ncbi:TolC family protein [Sulfurospirillum sp. 1307]